MGEESRGRLLLIAAGLSALILVGVSARGILLYPIHRMWGNHVDTVHHVWGHWWAAATQGPNTTLVSFPSGESGSILSPISAALVRPIYWLLGPIAAYNLLNVGHLLFAALGAGLCAHRLSGQLRAGALAAVAILVGRSLYLHVATGNTEGLVLGWLLLAAWQGIDWLRGRRNGGWVGLLFGVAVVENPYALLPAVALAAGLGVAHLRRHKDWKALAWPTLAGLIPTLGWLLWVGQGLGGNRESGYPMIWLGQEWMVYDWNYTAQLEQLLTPWPMLELSKSPSWLSSLPPGEFGGEHAMFARGGGIYLGLIPLALALWGRRAALWPLLLALGCLTLALGSLPWALSGGPFLFVNHGLGLLGMPLTQPVRFIPLAAAALAVAAGVGAARLPEALLPLALGLLLVEGLSLGGPRMEIPSLSNEGACLSSLSGGAVHLWAPPSRFTMSEPDQDPTPESTRLQAMLLQLHHRQPSTHGGIGGWHRRPPNPTFEGKLLALNAALTQGEAPPPEALTGLTQAGLGWIVLPEGQEQAWMPSPVERCGGWQAYSLNTLR